MTGWRPGLVLALVLAGCAHYPVNAPLAVHDPSAGYRFHPSGAGDGLTIFLFFSGGGTRAAALSYGALRALDQARPFPDRPDHSLLDDVDLISAVSGGSLTAAYYCLHGRDTFGQFDRLFLKQDVQDAILRRCLAPSGWFRLASPNFGRSDLAAEYYDRYVFGGATYADLMAPGRGGPFLVVNATDVVTGAGFAFTQDQFDLIGSDLGPFPIARAVAASCAWPVLLTPVTLRNYSGTAGWAGPDWLRRDGETPEEGGLPPDVRRLLLSYLDGRGRPYVHLVDGGFSDNIGLRAVFDVSAATGGLEKLIARLKARQTRRLAFIVVDASVDRASGWSEKGSTPGAISVLTTLGGSVQRRAAVALSELVRRRMADANRAEARLARRQAGVPPIPEEEPAVTLDFYFITVGFDDLAEAGERSFFLGLPSNFRLSPGTVDRLTDAGGRLLRQSPEFRRLLGDLGRAGGK